MRRFAAAAMFAMIATAAHPAAAQEGVGDLEACVVEATTADDRRALVRWMFSAISLSFLFSHVVVYGLLRNLCRTFKPRTVSVGGPLEGKVGSSDTKWPFNMRRRSPT